METHSVNICTLAIVKDIHVLHVYHLAKEKKKIKLTNQTNTGEMGQSETGGTDQLSLSSKIVTEVI